jgi:hypothetical protein
MTRNSDRLHQIAKQSIQRYIFTSFGLGTMFVRFVVLTGAFLVVSATASIGQSFICHDDRCCYPDGRCVPAAEAKAAKAAEEEKARQADEARGAAEAERKAGEARGAAEAERKAGEARAKATASPSPGRILETGYARLSKVGEEKPGYGLYSYVLITSYSDKAVALLSEIFKAIPDVKNAGASPKQINILYIPFLEKENEFVLEEQLARKDMMGTTRERGVRAWGEKYAESFYNFQMARTILAHLCNPPADVLRQLCGSDLSRGPFIFTYEKPASTFEPVEAPYLFVDLRDVHEHAFAEFVSAYQQQVKSEDVNSGERLSTLRLKLLNLALNAADFFKPIPEALADVIHSAKP